VCCTLGVLIFPVGVNTPVAGLYSSPVASAVAPVLPPATNIKPFGKSVEVAFSLAATRFPVGEND